MDLGDSTRLQIMILGLHFATPGVRWSETARLMKTSWVSLILIDLLAPGREPYRALWTVSSVLSVGRRVVGYLLGYEV